MIQPKKILVFTTNWLGDGLFLTPLLSGLKKNFPQADLTVLCLPRVKEIFQNNPNVNEIIIYDEKSRNLILRLKTFLRLRRERFDTAFIIKPSLSRTLLLKCAGIKEIVGFDNPKSGWLLTFRILPPDKQLHKLDYFLGILHYLGLKTGEHKYEFFPSQQDKDYIARLISQKGIARHIPLIVINPGANWHPKRWLPGNFAKLIKQLKKRLSVSIAISGAERDKQLSKKIINESGENVFDFSGQTTLGQLGALMQEAGVVVSADSGPMHIAAAVGTRVVALFGPTSPRLTGPYPLKEHIIIHKDVGCQVPCYDSNCKDYRCMNAITVDEIADKVTQLLSKT
jgi:lipopolysaccharide heptosyltransferase II